MKLSSLDIRKHVFSRVFRGYDVEEVHSFLQDVANQWQELVDDLRRSDERVKEQQLKLDHYLKVEEALQEALQTARAGARQTIENAERKARALIDEATRQAVEIARESETDRVNVKRETARYSIRQTEIVAKMRAFLLSELEILSQFDGEDPSGLLKLVSAESGRRRELVQDITDRAEESEEPGEIEALEEIEAPGKIEAPEEFEDLGEPEDLEEPVEIHPSFVFESDEDDTLADSAETEASGAGPAWTVNPLVSQEPGMTSPGESASSGESAPAVDIPDRTGVEGVTEDREKAASEEIRKIRRILEDLEK